MLWYEQSLHSVLTHYYCATVLFMEPSEQSLRDYLKLQYPDYTDADRQMAYDNLMELAGFIVQSNVNRTNNRPSLTESETSSTIENISSKSDV